MELFKHSVDPDALLGEWRVFAKHPTDEALSMRVRVRRIPSKIDDRLRRFAGYDNKNRVGVKGDTVMVSGDRYKSMKLNMLRASWAMTETENAEVRASDEGAAKFWSEQLSRSVAVGDLVNVDSAWGPNEVGKPSEVRVLVLTEQDALRNFVIKEADKMNLEADEAEEGKGETS